MEIIAADASLALTGPEDVIIGEAAIAAGESHSSDGRLIRTPYPMPRWDNHLITCHHLGPQDLHCVHALMESPHNLIKIGPEPNGSDHILLHRQNRYSWKISREAGIYQWLADMRRLLLCPARSKPGIWEVLDANAGHALGEASTISPARNSGGGESVRQP